MNIHLHRDNGVEIAEIVSDTVVINNAGDALDLMGSVYYSGYDRMVIHKKDITEDFFELKNGLAGEILQKFSTYRIRLVIVGDFKVYESKSLNDFIFESNKGKTVNFVETLPEALDRLAQN